MSITARFKGIVMLIMLMLIATRLTWLQTSALPIDISSTFYRTGLWFQQNMLSNCAVSPESTFPLPAEMVVRPDAIPPSPALGQLSPGLTTVMWARCQFGRMDVDDFSRWNPWLFMATALSCALMVRLLTSSWTAGLLAAVAVLSRGTLQSRATLAAAEPFAMVCVSISWTAVALFARSLWRGWLYAALLAWSLGVLFVPSLWFSMPIAAVLMLYCCIKAPSSEFLAQKTSPWQTQNAESISQAMDRRRWLNVVLISIGFLVVTTSLMRWAMPGSLMDLSILKQTLGQTWNGPRIVGVYHTILSIAGDYSRDVDLHSLVAMIFVLIHPAKGGHLGGTGRSIALGFLCLTAGQVLINLWIEAVLSQSGLAPVPSLIPSIRSVEPLFIAWGTASFWRILDAVFGYRLSDSGWSIRGHARGYF